MDGDFGNGSGVVRSSGTGASVRPSTDALTLLGYYANEDTAHGSDHTRHIQSSDRVVDVAVGIPEET